LDDNSKRANVVKMLVANKIDEPKHSVSREEGQELAKTYGMLFQETSAKTRQNVDSVFREMVKKIVLSELIDTCKVIELDIVPSSKNKWCKC
ncbi:Ras- protein Rab-18, partial [Cichlidogyrus casuarinus]